MHSDHKPLESTTKKPLHQAPPRLQLMLLWLMKYDLRIKYVPGKNMYIADALSRAYIETTEDTPQQHSDDLDKQVHGLVTNLPISNEKRTTLQQATREDRTLRELQKYFKYGWPRHSKQVSQEARKYWSFQEEIHEADGLLFVGPKLIIPNAKRAEILAIIHSSHLGIEKCKARARGVMYWPGMSVDIEECISNCQICKKFQRRNQKEPMIPHEIPELPWNKLGSDIFQFGGDDYVVIVDYMSKYPEVLKLKNKTATEIICKMKECFSRHGIPETLIADNMPYASLELRKFAKEWGFKITSPGYPTSNGLSERYVQTVKQLMRKAYENNEDPYPAVMDFRDSPVSGFLYNHFISDNITSFTEAG